MVENAVAPSAKELHRMQLRAARNFGEMTVPHKKLYRQTSKAIGFADAILHTSGDHRRNTVVLYPNGTQRAFLTTSAPIQCVFNIKAPTSWMDIQRSCIEFDVSYVTSDNNFDQSITRDPAIRIPESIWNWFSTMQVLINGQSIINLQNANYLGKYMVPLMKNAKMCETKFYKYGPRSNYKETSFSVSELETEFGVGRMHIVVPFKDLFVCTPSISLKDLFPIFAAENLEIRFNTVPVANTYFKDCNIEFSQVAAKVGQPTGYYIENLQFIGEFVEMSNETLTAIKMEAKDNVLPYIYKGVRQFYISQLVGQQQGLMVSAENLSHAEAILIGFHRKQNGNALNIAAQPNSNSPSNKGSCVLTKLISPQITQGQKSTLRLTMSNETIPLGRGIQYKSEAWKFLEEALTSLGYDDVSKDTLLSYPEYFNQPQYAEYAGLTERDTHPSNSTAQATIPKTPVIVSARNTAAGGSETFVSIYADPIAYLPIASAVDAGTYALKGYTDAVEELTSETSLNDSYARRTMEFESFYYGVSLKAELSRISPMSGISLAGQPIQIEYTSPGADMDSYAMLVQVIYDGAIAFSCPDGQHFYAEVRT